MDIDEQISQVEFAALVGITKQAVSSHIQAGVLPETGTAGEWIQAYCERLRAEASGRTLSKARERRDEAQAAQAEVRAKLDQLELLRQYGVIVDVHSVEQYLMGAMREVKNHLARTLDDIVRAVESQHKISVGRDLVQARFDAACHAIAAASINVMKQITQNNGSDPDVEP